MRRTTLHPERSSRQSEVPALFGQTVYFSGQEGETGLFHQGHFPAAAADVAEVYVGGDQGLFMERRFRHDRPPGVDDVRVAPEDQVVLFSDAIDEDNVALEHAGVEAGVEGAHALSWVVVLSLFVDPVVGQVELAVQVPEDPSFEIRRAVEVLEALPLLAEPHDHGHLSRGLGQGAYGLALRLDGDIVVELFQGVAGQAQLGEDDEVSAPAFRLSYFLYRLAEVLVSVAKDTVDLGQRFPQGPSLALSAIRACKDLEETGDCRTLRPAIATGSLLR